jgi:hypothetical protein
VNRATLTLLEVVAALAVIAGIATVLAPTDSGTAASAAAVAVRKPVERSTLLCPAVTGSDYASTTYTSFTPAGTGSGADGSARLLPGQISGSGTGSSTGTGTGPPASGGKPVAPLTDPGKPVTASTGQNAVSPLLGTADGRFAPGWTVQQTTTIDAGPGRGLLGLSCGAPGADFWFPGAGTASGSQDYVHLTNPDDTAAVVDIELYDGNGQVKSTDGDGLTVPGGSSLPVLLSTLTAEQTADLTVHVAVRSGRVAAAVQVMDDKRGSDWLAPAAAPADSAVLPGIPGDATSVHLVAYATGVNDADLKVRLLTPSGAITPAGHETVHLKSGMTTSVDLPNLTQGQAGSLILTPSDPARSASFVAALRVTRGQDPAQEIAFVPATTPVGRRASVADNRPKSATVSLAAPGGDATVRITTSASTDGGTPVTKTVTVTGGTTLAVDPPQPSSGSGAFAVSIEPVSGGPVYASRTLALPQDHVPGFTIQTMPDDGGTVAVPDAGQDLSVLQR